MDFKWVEVKSSNISHVYYEAKTEQMFIKFCNGRIYKYFDVLLYEYDDLIHAKSIGSNFNIYIKPKQNIEIKE